MDILSANNCRIITIIPMEVECNVINTTSPFATDGTAQVLINGGTLPYSITWGAGQQGDMITNLSVGTYSAIITDYYGDYVISTTCVVESDSETVYQFNGCNSNSGETIYVSGSTYDPPFPNLNPFIQFNEISGCYEFITQISNSGLTYSALTVSNSYVSCDDCEPPIIPPLPQDNLCLSNGVVQYDFTTNGTDSDGNYQWINNVDNMVMTYNIMSLQWEVTPWGNVGVDTMIKTQSPPSLQPLGAWVNTGNPNGVSTNWVVTVGVCDGIPLTLNSQPMDPLCEGETGSVVMNGSGGVPPYQYQIQGITAQQNSGVFNNLPSNNYVGIVQDSDIPSNIETVNFVIGTGLPAINYQLSLTYNSGIGLQNQASNTLTNSYEYGVSVFPALPVGVTMSFNLVLSHTRETQSAVNGNSVKFTNTFDGDINGTPIIMTDTSPTSNPISQCGESTVGDVTTFTTNSPQITIDSTSVVSGTLTETVSLNDVTLDCTCPTIGKYDTGLQAINITINGDCTQLITSTSNSVPLNVTVSDCVTQKSSSSLS